MNSQELLQADLLDIIFQHRNKQYGAYALRKQYNSRMGWALGMGLSGMLLLLLLFRINTGEQLMAGIIPEKDGVIIRQVDIPKPPEPPKLPSQPSPPPQVASASLTNDIRVVDRPDPLHLMQTNAEMEHMAIGNTNEEGLATTTVQSAPETPVAGNGNAASSSTESVFVAQERAPEFPGGQQAWTAFLMKYLRTPGDLDPGEKRVVMIRFIVDTEGNVTQFQVMQSGGTAYDNEVIRVMKKMPRWTPGIQNGHPVTLAFTQPVTFVGSEQ